MVNKVILVAKIDAANSSSFDITVSQSVIHVICAGLQAAEVADIQIYSELVSGNWVDYYHDGDKQTLTATQTGRTVLGYGRYRVQKPTTAVAVGVEINEGFFE